MHIQRHENNTNEVLISAAASAIEQMKYEIARELDTWPRYKHVKNGSCRWRNYKTLNSNG